LGREEDIIFITSWISFIKTAADGTIISEQK